MRWRDWEESRLINFRRDIKFRKEAEYGARCGEETSKSLGRVTNFDKSKAFVFTKMALVLMK